MIQIIIDAIGPALVLAVFLGALFVLALRMANHRIALWRANRRLMAVQARTTATRNRACEQALAAAGDAVAATIAELATRPATYATFPPDVVDLLQAAHTSVTSLDTTKETAG